MRLLMPIVASLSFLATLASAHTQRPGLTVVEALHQANRFHFDVANQMRRHPMCAENIRAVVDAENIGQATLALATAVHECGHAFNGERSDRDGTNPTVHFALSETVAFTCRLRVADPQGRVHSATALPVKQIQNDRFAKKRPACKSGEQGGCDWYATTYLDGDMGEQGLDFLLEELTQYIHTLETASALKVYLEPKDRLSARDSLLSLMWYTQRYLAFVRQNDPAWFAAVVRDECWSKLVVELWDHAQEALRQSAGEPRLGVESEALEQLVADPLLSQEVQLLRQQMSIGASRSPALKTHR